MGYRRAAQLRRLTFESPEFAGLEVETRLPSIRVYTRVAALTTGLVLFDPGRADDVAELFDTMAEYFDSWNLEAADGAPIPVSAEAMHELDKDMAQALLESWCDALAGVPDPLPSASDGGSPADAIPMTAADLAS